MSSINIKIFIIIYLTHLVVLVLTISTPILEKTPQDFYSRFGSLEMKCQARGDPSPIISWHHYDTKRMVQNEDNIQVFYTANKQMSRLLITEPIKRHLYQFYCNATNQFGETISPKVSAGLIYLDSQFPLNPPQSKITVANHPIRLSCQPPNGIPTPNVTWIRNGNEPLLAPHFQITTQPTTTTTTAGGGRQYFVTLTIPQPQIYDSGTYQCVANNGYQVTKSTITNLQVVKDNNKRYQITEEFKFQLGSVARIPCPLLSNPRFRRQGLGRSTVSWYRINKDGTDKYKLNIDGRGSIVENRMLQIDNVNSADAGLYVCRVVSKKQGVVVMESVASVIVEEKARFYETPESQTVSEGSDVTFRCIVAGLPKPKVYWEIPGNRVVFPLSSTFSRFHLATTGILRINSVRQSDAGKYTCNFHSSLDASHTSAYLKVQPRDLQNYPVISLPPQNQTLRAGSTVTFRCEVVSQPEAIISWYRESDPPTKLEPGPRVSLPTRGALQIRDISPHRDSAPYTCVASLPNSRIQTKWTSTLLVIPPESLKPLKTPLNDESLLPMSPVLSRPRHITQTSVTLDWSTQGHPTVSTNQSYWVEYVRFGSRQGWRVYRYDWPRTRITIGNLQSDSYYQFLVRARNQYGLSRASVPTDYVKTHGPGDDAEDIVKMDEEGSEILQDFTRISIESLDLKPILFGRLQVQLRLSLPSQTSNNMRALRQLIDGFQVSYTMQPIPNCLSNQRDLSTNYCSLNILATDPAARTLLNKAPPSALPTWPSQESPSNLTRGYIMARAPMLPDQPVIKSVLSGLNGFSCYRFQAQLYSKYKNIRSQLSTPVYTLMLEDKPSKSPINVQTSWNLPSTLVIQFQLPASHTWHGVPLGAWIRFLDSQSNEPILIKRQFNFTNLLSDTPQIRIKNLRPHLNYTFIISLYNCHGEGARSPPILVPSLNIRSDISSQQAPWFIPVTVMATLLFWVLLCCLVVYLCCVRCRHGRGGCHGNGLVNKGTGMVSVTKGTITKDIAYHRAAPPPPIVTTSSLPSEALYSTTSVISPGHNNNTGSCTPYASASIIDSNCGDNNHSNYYTGALLDELGVISTSGGLGNVPPPYLTYAPYSQIHQGPPPPPLLVSHSGGGGGVLQYPNTTTTSHNTNNSFSFAQLFGSNAFKDDGMSHTTNTITTTANHKSHMYPSNTLATSTQLKMGISGLPNNNSVGGSSSSASGGVGGGGTSQPRNPDLVANGNCSIATLGSTPPSLSGGIGSDSNSAATGPSLGLGTTQQELKQDDSPRSTVHYDVIPTTEGSNYEDNDDDFDKEDSDEDDDGEDEEEEEEDDDDDDADESPILKEKPTNYNNNYYQQQTTNQMQLNLLSNQLHHHHQQQQQPLPSPSNNSSDAYSTVAIEIKAPSQHNKKKNKRKHQGVSITKHLKQRPAVGIPIATKTSSNRVYLQNSKI